MAASLSSKAQIARSAVIKGLAAALMVVDHVGVVFFPGTPLFRYLGRLSFPLFCWLLAQGERRTRDVYRYGLRLLAFGLLSQPPYSALFGGFQLNVLFTLLVGLVTLRLARERPQWAYFIWPLGVMISALIPMDGGGYGVAVMLLMAQPMTLRWWGFWVLLHGVLAATGGITSMQLWAIPAPLIVLLIDGGSPGGASPPAAAIATGDNEFKGQATPEQGQADILPPAKRASRWFYWFYPGHLLALWLVRWLV